MQNIQKYVIHIDILPYSLNIQRHLLVFDWVTFDILPYSLNIQSLSRFWLYDVWYSVLLDCDVGVVNNEGQFPFAKGEALAFLGTGPMCRYATDLVPMFKVLVLPEFKDRLQLNDQV